MLGAVNFGAVEYQHVINAIIDLAEQVRQGAMAAGRGEPGEEGR